MVNTATQNPQLTPTQYTQQVFPNLPVTEQQTLSAGDQKMYKMMTQMITQMMTQMNLNKYKDNGFLKPNLDSRKFE